MNCNSLRDLRVGHLPLLAILLFQGVNPAQAAGTTTTDISLSPTTLDFKYTMGTALPASQTLQIKSTTSTALAFTIPQVAAPWISLSAYSGTTPASIKVFVNPTSLPSGSQQATITVNAPGAATASQTYIVTLEVSDPPPTLVPNTTTMAFTYATDAAAFPAAQPLVLTSTGAAISATLAVTGGTWLTAQYSGAISIVGIPSTINVSVNPTGLAPGSYSGTIKITPSVTTVPAVTVAVTLAVSAGTPIVTGLWPPGALVNSPNMVVTVSGSNFFSTSTASIGAVKLAAPNVISTTAMLVTIPASQLTAAGNLPITITTPTAAGSSVTTAASTFKVYLPGPQVLAITDAASYAVGNISPGEIITIYGLGLGPSTLAPLTVQDPLQTSLPTAGTAQTQVTIDGVAAPLLYTSVNEVSCIVPFTVAAKSGQQVDLVVTYNSIATASPTKVKVIDANPGLFTMDASGGGQGAILNYNPVTADYSINGTTNQAVKGVTIAVLYMTGFGLTNCSDIPAVGTSPADPCKVGATVLNLIHGNNSPKLAVAVTIDGSPAPGAVAEAPLGGVPGVMQVNVPVPAGVKSGAVPVVVTIGSGATAVTTQSKVTMSIK
jgi:trimeric autotransporter adhesin